MSRLERNLKLFPILEVLRSLIFIVPVWVAYELQFISLVQLTLIESLMVATQLVLELPTGAFADLIGRKHSLMMGMGLLFAALLVYSQATTFIMFVAFGLLIGASDAFVSGSREAILYDSYKELGREHELLQVSAKLNLYFQGGLAFATIVGGLIAIYGIKLPIYVYAAGVLLTMFFTSLFYEPTVDSAKFSVRSYLKQIGEGVRETTRSAVVRNFSLFYVLVGGVTWTAVLALNNIWMTNSDFSEKNIGLILGIIRIINAFVLFRLVKIQTIFSERSSLLVFPLMLLLALLPGYWLKDGLIIPVIAVTMFVSSARWAVLGKYMNDHFASRRRATANSFLSMAIGFFYMIALFLAGQLGQLSGNVGIIYSLYGLLALGLILPIGLKLRKQLVGAGV